MAGRRVGDGEPSFVIAEAGVNHNGSPGMARKLVDAAADAGADVVKFQTFRADALVTAGAPMADYQKSGAEPSDSQYEMLKRLELPPAAYHDLRDYCVERGVIFMSTPFDEDSADFLEELGVPAFKVPSGEITNLALLGHIAQKGIPMFVSTGMSWLEEVGTALATIEEAGNRDVVLLHCVSNYPADPANSNLLAMKTMRNAFDVLVGFSDHTLGAEVALAAVALGACVVEKHFTLDRTLPGPDHGASLEPEELRAMVEGIRIVESSLGDGDKRPTEGEQEMAAIVRRSLVAADEIPAGATITAEMLATKRPGTGLPPSACSELVGSTAKEKIPAGTVLRREMLS